MSRTGEGHPVVALHLSYFTENFGDLLLFDFYRRWIRELVPGAAVVAPAAPPEVHRWLGADATGWRAAARAGAFVYGGGGYFGPVNDGARRWATRNLGRHVPTGALARVLGRPLTVNGVGVGTVSSPAYRRAVTAIFRAARQATVRDEESLGQLVSWGLDPASIRATADAVLTLEPGDIPAEARAEAAADLDREPGVRLIGVHLPARAPEHEAGVLGMCEALALADPAIRFVVMRDTHPGATGPPGGSLGAAVLRRFGRRAAFVVYRSPWQLAAVIALLDGVITSQLHVGIVALACGRPALSLAEHPKTVRLYRQLGSPWRTVRLGESAGVDLPGLAVRALLEPSGVLVPPGVRAAAAENRTRLGRFLAEAWPASADVGILRASPRPRASFE